MGTILASAILEDEVKALEDRLDLEKSRGDAADEDFIWAVERKIKALKVGLAAVEKQVAKEVVEPFRSAYKIAGKCPSCGAISYSSSDYCDGCGQALYWPKNLFKATGKAL